MDELTQQLYRLYSLNTWWGWAVRLLTVIAAAIVIRAVAQFLVRRAVHSAWRTRRLEVSERRTRTLEGLLTSIVTVVVWIGAIIGGALSLGAPSDSLVVALGLFSAGFGVGASRLVSDYLAGFALLFENPYAFGEKVEIQDVIGTVEQVGIRLTEIRADSGELFIVPNGDVRIIRNFSRGAFSPASVKVMVAPQDLAVATQVLKKFAIEACERYDDVIDKPEVISEMGELGAKTQLTLAVRARFGHGAQLRRQLLEDVHQALVAAGVETFV